VGKIFDSIANSGDGVFAVDSQQSIVLWNDRASQILGFSAKEVLGKKCYQIVCGRDHRGCVVCHRGCKAITSARRLQPAMTADITVQTKTGNELWLNLSTIVLSSRHGDLSVLVHLFREVTRDHNVLSSAAELADTVSRQASKEPVEAADSTSKRSATIKLTNREREILALMASGYSTGPIAARLSISPRTVGNHVTNILRKLGLHSRLEAVTYSIRNGLV